uniref:Lipoxygenase domain-containing protein n=1 Tax=Nothobranchius kuhntae TaxID=321403 RepID=A0A1A8KWE5_NOTKU
MRTHLLAEVFAVSLLRNLPMVHPLYKLLIPHTRYTLQINFLARLRLISKEGVFTLFSSSGGEGIPERFNTVAELIKFVTMVIFTGSAQHAAVNSGQYDFGGWMPNTPISLQLPPPTTKGQTTEATMLNTLPDVNVTVQGMATLWLLSQQSTDFVPLGQYPEDHFTEETPQRMVKGFQKELEVLSAAIKDRNEHLEVPYVYLDPVEVENSVAI